MYVCVGHLKELHTRAPNSAWSLIYNSLTVQPQLHLEVFSLAHSHHVERDLRRAVPQYSWLTPTHAQVGRLLIASLRHREGDCLLALARFSLCHSPPISRKTLDLQYFLCSALATSLHKGSNSQVSSPLSLDDTFRQPHFSAIYSIVLCLLLSIQLMSLGDFVAMSLVLVSPVTYIRFLLLPPRKHLITSTTPPSSRLRRRKSSNGRCRMPSPTT